MNRLKLDCLDTKAKWSLAVSLYMKDLQFVQNEYNANKQSPPLPRDFPPISGRIAWSRQLYNRVSKPIEIFQKYPSLLKLPETRKAIKSFNKMAQVLVEYELLHLQLWHKKIAEVERSLNATLLIRNPGDKELIVNFDPKINELMREIDVMGRMGIDIPPKARLFRTKREELKKKFNNIKVQFIDYVFSYYFIKLLL